MTKKKEDEIDIYGSHSVKTVCKHEWRQHRWDADDPVDGYYCIHCLALVCDKDDKLMMIRFPTDNDFYLFE